MKMKDEEDEDEDEEDADNNEQDDFFFEHEGRKEEDAFRLRKKIFPLSLSVMDSG